MTSEAEYRKHKKYVEKLKQKGIKQHIFRCTDEQYLLLKSFFTIIKKVDTENLVALDVSEDGIKFIFDKIS